jgi:hypothetical protein
MSDAQVEGAFLLLADGASKADPMNTFFSQQAGGGSAAPAGGGSQTFDAFGIQVSDADRERNARLEGAYANPQLWADPNSKVQ